MNDRERAICDNVRRFRESINWSQKDVADRIGLTRDQFAHIEYQRTPLRYDVACRIRTAFAVSVDWLFSGEGNPYDLFDDNGLPHPAAADLPKNALVTEVFDRIYPPVGGAGIKKSPVKKPRWSKAFDDDLAHRSSVLTFVKHSLDSWLSRVPAGSMEDFCDKIAQFVEAYLGALPKESNEVVEARIEALKWLAIRNETEKRILLVKNAVKSHLTDAETSFSVSEVKAQLPGLLDRLKKATAETGKKSELAKFLSRATKQDVPLASVSRWLSGEREPGGEVALQLEVWATAQGFPRGK